MAAADPIETALLTILRMAGLTLSLDADREAVISGNRNALAVWHALAAAIDQLDALVLAGLDAEARDAEEAVAQLPIAAEPEPAPEVVAPAHAGPAHAGPAGPEWPKPRPGPRTDSGIPYLDGVALAWRARRDLARRHNMPFEEPPPYSWEEDT